MIETPMKVPDQALSKTLILWEKRSYGLHPNSYLVLIFLVNDMNPSSHQWNIPHFAMNVVTFDSGKQRGASSNPSVFLCKNEAQIVAGGWFGCNLILIKHTQMSQKKITTFLCFCFLVYGKLDLKEGDQVTSLFWTKDRMKKFFFAMALAKSQITGESWITLPKFNMEPENGPWKRRFLFGNHQFSGAMLVPSRVLGHTNSFSLMLWFSHQEFQVPKMEVLNLVRLFWWWVFPYISLIYSL